MIAIPVLPRGHRKLRSFSLVELLFAVAIAAVLTVLSVTAYVKIIRATTITAGVQSIVAAYDLARQTAVTRNTDVQFCFYLLPDFNAAPTATPTVCRAYQAFIAVAGTTNQLTKVNFLPNQALISGDATKTTLMNIPAVAPVVIGNASFPTNVTLPVYGANYKAITFAFSPNGGIEPATGMTTWIATIYLENDPVVAGTSLPADFAAIQIDPFNGVASVYRP